jgi:Cytochrome c554 and c-prime
LLAVLRWTYNRALVEQIVLFGSPKRVRIPRDKVEFVMAASNAATDGLPDPQAKWDLFLIAGGGLLLIIAVLWGITLSLQPTRSIRRVTSTAAPAPTYIGSQSCAACHPGEAAAHSRSGHARTLRRAAEIPLAKRLVETRVADPEDPAVTWGYSLRDGKFFSERRTAGAVERLAIDYAFGSGHHATTFVSLTDGTDDHPTSIEHRMTVFAHKELPDITPGQARDGDREGIGPRGRHHSTEKTLKCFECHTTTTSNRGPLALDEATMIRNIGCERCHGPAGSHVDAAQRGAGKALLAMPFGPERWTVQEQLRMCGDCHRLPEMGDPNLIRSDNPVLARFQPIGLMKSACYRKSSETLSCVTCHDPHSRTSTNQAAYESVCLSCHQGAGRTPCKIAAKSGCINCHMPRRDVSRGMMMTDHWIRSP